MQEKIVEFLRKRDYIFVEDLGQGATGRTVLLYDDIINKHFVCKKYSPASEDHRQELFSNFIREIKLLHQIHHPNLVRIFNYYLYPEQLTGYILMEHIDGLDIEDFLSQTPETTSDLFEQAISAFKYLEENTILHRDIRPMNILVGFNDVLKVIDLGFGKRIEKPDDFDKSVSLNWWCEPPLDFNDEKYDFKTEIYFVGKLFEKIIQENNIDHFKFKDILGLMCQRNPESRIDSFFDIETRIQRNRSSEINFHYSEENAYRIFAQKMFDHLTKIESGTKYISDFDLIVNKLDSAYRSFMLEETVPDAALITRCFISGQYYYNKAGFPVSVVKNFLQLLKSTSQEKRRIILANLHTKLDSIQRYTARLADDDIPF